MPCQNLFWRWKVKIDPSTTYMQYWMTYRTCMLVIIWNDPIDLQNSQREFINNDGPIFAGNKGVQLTLYNTTESAPDP